MTFARVSGPGDLRTLGKGFRGDDGIPGRERPATDDACRRSRDVGKLRRKSRIVVYRNVKMVFPFVLCQLRDGYMKNSEKIWLVNNIVFFVIWLGVMTIALSLYYWLVVPLLSRFGLPDHAMYFVIFASPFMFLAYAVYKYILKKVSRVEE